MIYAYVSIRGVTHHNPKELRHHAVDELSQACGALDTFCGRVMTKPVGEWAPDDPNNCRACAVALAETEKVTT